MTDYPPNMTLRPLDGWPGSPTVSRRRAPFRSTLASTLGSLRHELHMLGNGGRYYDRSAYPVSILQLALRERDIRIDGMPRADAKVMHPGIILSVEPHGQPPLSFPCDTFVDWQDNVRAVTLTLEALRKIDRYGVTQTGQQYRGWQAIEAAPTVDARAAACAVLARTAWPNENDDCQASWAQKIATDPEIGRNTLRQARAKAHPDRHGGDRTLWDHVEGAAKVVGLS